MQARVPCLNRCGAGGGPRVLHRALAQLPHAPGPTPCPAAACAAAACGTRGAGADPVASCDGRRAGGRGCGRGCSRGRCALLAVASSLTLSPCPARGRGLSVRALARASRHLNLALLSPCARAHAQGIPAMVHGAPKPSGLALVVLLAGAGNEYPGCPARLWSRPRQLSCAAAACLLCVCLRLRPHGLHAFARTMRGRGRVHAC